MALASGSAAKRSVFGVVGIDMVAGPSEILVVCDGKTDAGELKSLDKLGIVKIDTKTGSFTKAELLRYDTIHHRDEIGYVEHGTYAGINTFGVGSRMVIGGRVLQDFQLGC